MDFPIDFADYSRRLMGEALYRTLEKGLEEVPPTSIRLNTFKYKGDVTASRLFADRVGWCSEGVYLTERPNFTFDPLLHAGLYYVQEASSMFLAHVLRFLVRKPVTMLDLCAAPGGKTTVARTVLPAGSLLFANEPDRKRVQILSENVQKFGHPDVVVTNNYPRDYRKSSLQFDVIVADVPCSGEGMFRKDEGALAEWSPQNVDNCWRLQREIIADVWPCLKPGGWLIYSTCTFNAHEDEENTRWIADELGAEHVAVEVPEAWHLTGSLIDHQPVYRFIPGKSKGEGLYMAVLRKPGDDGGVRGKAPKAAKPVTLPARIGGWLTDAQAYTLVPDKDLLTAIPQRWAATYLQAAKSLRIVHAGIPLATVKGKDYLPTQSLALSTALSREAFPQAPVDYLQAMAYLRKEAIVLPADTPRGIVLITYRDIPLGFAKNLGNRANNLSPAEWRIKSTHTPDQEPNIIPI